MAINLNNQFCDIAESGNNYIKFSDGTLICYGLVTIPAGSSSATVQLPHSFKEDWSYYVNITNGYTYRAECFWSVAGIYKNNFKVYETSDNKTNFQRDGYWLAIGKWK